MIDDRFDLTFVNASRDPRPAARRDSGDHDVERLEIFHRDDRSSLLRKVLAMTTIPVSTPVGPRDLLVEARAWTTPDRTRAPVRTGQGVMGPRPDTQGFIQAQFAPALSADWVDYTVSAQVDQPGSIDGTVGVTVRDGSAQPVRVRLSARQAQIVDHRDRVLATVDLTSSKTHDITLVVDRKVTTVSIDDALVATVPVTDRGSSTGGVGVDWSGASGAADVDRLVVRTI